MNNLNLYWNKEQIKEIKIFLEKFNLVINDDSQLIILQDAFTHSSYTQDKHISISYDYTRLAFLGDALIGKIISTYLFFNTNWDKGDMSIYMQGKVSNEKFTMIAKKYKFENFILVGKSYKFNSPDKNKPIEDSIYSDMFEALAAAIFLTFGEKILENFLIKILFKQTKG